MNKNTLFQNKNINIQNNNCKAKYVDNSQSNFKVFNGNINEEIEKIFAEKSGIKRINVLVKYNGLEENHILIGKTDNFLLTIDKKKLYIKDIEKIIKI